MLNDIYGVKEMGKLAIELALKDIESSFKTHPRIRDYVIEMVKERAEREVLWYKNTGALIGDLPVFVLDMVTYIGAPILAKRVLGRLILEHGEPLLEKAMQAWVKKNIDQIINTQ